MPAFAPVLKSATKRAGGEPDLEKLLPKPKSADELKAAPDDRYFSLMSRRVFQAGLKHSMVDAKWPAVEEVFLGFEPRRVAAMPDEEIEKLMADRRLIRHWGKLKATHHNAAAFVTVSDESGGFGAYLADWPAEDVVGLWRDLSKRFKQLGGNSGPYFLRMAGKDTFLLTGDVVRALEKAGVCEGKPTSQSALNQVQAAFNEWAAESGRPLCQLSRILALSIG
jgi:3-methyladenine DNA glycosylase Tag